MILKRLWNWIRQPSTRWSAGALLVAGGLTTMLAWGGFNTAMDMTNTTAFCVSCHEMNQLVHQEYKQSAHFSNASGVRAGCPDCHVPREWGRKILRKIRASAEVYASLTGKINTPEKFEAHRLEMAERVWKEMTENNSQECRNCHSYDAMDIHKQSQRAQEKMKDGRLKNKPCIECHKGISHKKPEVERDD